jgi:assimilatory nitrate reductase electron transfer subunit
VHVGVTATGIDRRQQVVHTDDGADHGYDVLVLATGARPLIPEIPGLNGDHVRTLRTLPDCRRIATATGPIAVLGGGILGVETARALLSKHPGVTLVHPLPHPMERQLDAAGGRLLADRLEGLGVDLRLGRLPTAYRPGKLVLDNADVVGADLVVVCAGVRPETGLAARAGLAVQHGIVIDEQLRTSDPRVFAIGDCAEHCGNTPGLAAAAWEQADTLAELLTGGTARYRGARTAARLRARDIDLVSLGSLDELTGPEAETVALSDPARGRYAKLALRGKRITGAVLLGFPQAIASITQLHDRELPVPGDWLALLLGTPPAGRRDPVELPEDTVICRCNNVTKKALAAAHQRGACTVGELVAATRATTGCGACADDVRCLGESLTGATAQESTA